MDEKKDLNRGCAVEEKTVKIKKHPITGSRQTNLISFNTTKFYFNRTTFSIKEVHPQVHKQF